MFDPQETRPPCLDKQQRDFLKKLPKVVVLQMILPYVRQHVEARYVYHEHTSDRCVFVYGDFISHYITYGPHKAVAEVSKDKEPIGRGCAEFNWFESQLMSDSSEVRFK